MPSFVLYCSKKDGVMNGSMLSQPPILTPRMGILPYSNVSLRLGAFSFACTLSSHVELRPIIGSPPTVAAVYVTLKSKVSYHEKGSRIPPLAEAGISDSDIELRLL